MTIDVYPRSAHHHQTKSPETANRSTPSGTMRLVLAIVLLSALTVIAASVVVFG